MLYVSASRIDGGVLTSRRRGFKLIILCQSANIR